MGGGWLGGGWQGGGWQGGGWQGGGWQGGGWAGGGGSEGLYAMRADRPLVAEDVRNPAARRHSQHFRLMPGTAICLRSLFCRISSRPTVAGKTWACRCNHNQRWTIPNRCYARWRCAAGDDRIDDLRILAVTERPEAMGEILNQHQNQQLCFMQLLMMTATSHPDNIFRDETGCSRRRSGDDASEASLQQTTAHAILSDPVPACASARPFGLSGRPRAHRAPDRKGPDRSDGHRHFSGLSPYKNR